MAQNSDKEQSRKDPSKETRSALVSLENGYFDLGPKERRAFVLALIDSLNPNKKPGK